MVRNSAATMSLCDLGISASRLRAKWTRQRWWAAPWKQRRRAATRPACWSEITRRPPDRPRLTQVVQKRPPERLLLAVAHGQAEHLPTAGGGDPGGHYDGLGHHLPEAGFAHVQIGRVEVDVGEAGVPERAGRRTHPPPHRGRRRSATPRTWRSRRRCPGQRPGHRPTG